MSDLRCDCLQLIRSRWDCLTINRKKQQSWVHSPPVPKPYSSLSPFFIFLTDSSLSSSSFFLFPGLFLFSFKSINWKYQQNYSLYAYIFSLWTLSCFHVRFMPPIHLVRTLEILLTILSKQTQWLGILLDFWPHIDVRIFGVVLAQSCPW